MEWKRKYLSWSKSKVLPISMLDELGKMDEKTAFDSFYKYLEFGTGGMRGKLGVGTNRINSVMVRRLTEALAIYLKETREDNEGVIISYDNRTLSKEFAAEAAKVLSFHNIKVYLSDEVRPTPIVSMLILEKKLAAGIMITASHNPAEYNGYKIYNSEGYQITQTYADELTKILNQIDNEEQLTYPSLTNNNNVQMLGNEIEELYLDKLDSMNIDKDLIKYKSDELKVVYTPLHGAGEKLVQLTLDRIGFEHVHLVSHQADFDSNFSTVKSPNPEDVDSFYEAIKLGKETHAELLIATDPDADRVGISVWHNNEYRLISGNELGVLLLHYLAEKKDCNKNYYAVKTIVTTDLSKKIAQKYDIDIKETLTGFKYIGELITEKENDNDEFLLGFEESYGYLLSTFVRDKDAIQSVAVISEMVLYYKTHERTLVDQLNDIYEEFGYFKDELITIEYQNSEEIEKLDTMLQSIRDNIPIRIGDYEVQYVEDYLVGKKTFVENRTKEILPLPKSNVLKLFLDDYSWLVIRPSGTEPKCKIYISVSEKNEESVINKLTNIKVGFLDLINQLENKG